MATGNRPTYVFAGGGTGGHLFPAIAIATALREETPHCEILFIGSDRQQEREIVRQAGFRHVGLKLVSRRELYRRPWAFLGALCTACRTANRLLREASPLAVIGCGGLISLPAVRAGYRLGVPVVLLEQNVLPGKATRWLSRYASDVCLSFDESRQWFSSKVTVHVTGNPVRRAIQEASRVSPDHDVPQFLTSPNTSQQISEETTVEDPNPTRSSLESFIPASPTLLILGGTLGSREINDGVLDGLKRNPHLWRGWRIVHQTGVDDCARLQAGYLHLGLVSLVEPFIPDVVESLSTAAIVVSRAGATTLAELACCGRPTVVVPWRGAADDHQLLNARWYTSRQAMLLGQGAESHSTPSPPDSQPFWAAVERLLGDQSLRQSLSTRLRELARPDATQAIQHVLAARISRSPQRVASPLEGNGTDLDVR